MDETLPFVGMDEGKDESLSAPVVDLLRKHGLLDYHSARVALPGCTLSETPQEFLAEWTAVYDYFRNRLLRPLTTCASEADRDKVTQRLRAAVAMANREQKRRYPVTA